MQRHQALVAWTQSSLNDPDCYLKPASSDASFRSYWRVFSENKTYIIMDAPPEHEDCCAFIEISQRLERAGINAPIVLNKDLEQGFLLLTDLGSRHYLDTLNEENSAQLYKDAIDSIQQMQRHAETEDLPLYDENLLKTELDLFSQWFVKKHLGLNLNTEQNETLKNCENLLIQNATSQPQSFVHRDFHSRNLMVTKHNNPGVIDFQDAVFGPVTYDLVSLLRDCYIRWDDDFIYDLLEAFRLNHNSEHQLNSDRKTWEKWFDLMGMQRHMKAIGIFCRLNYRDNKPAYLKDIPLTLSYLKSMSQKHAEFTNFASLLEEISPNISMLCKP